MQKNLDKADSYKRETPGSIPARDGTAPDEIQQIEDTKEKTGAEGNADGQNDAEGNEETGKDYFPAEHVRFPYFF